MKRIITALVTTASSASLYADMYCTDGILDLGSPHHLVCITSDKTNPATKAMKNLEQAGADALKVRPADCSDALKELNDANRDARQIRDELIYKTKAKPLMCPRSGDSAPTSSGGIMGIGAKKIDPVSIALQNPLRTRIGMKIDPRFQKVKSKYHELKGKRLTLKDQLMPLKSQLQCAYNLKLAFDRARDLHSELIHLFGSLDNNCKMYKLPLGDQDPVLGLDDPTCGSLDVSGGDQGYGYSTSGVRGNGTYGGDTSGTRRPPIGADGEGRPPIGGSGTFGGDDAGTRKMPGQDGGGYPPKGGNGTYGGDGSGRPPQ